MQKSAASGQQRARKGQIWISAVIYIMIAVAVLVIVLEAGIPIISGLREKTSFERSRETMLGLDQQIKDVAGEGLGSQRVVPVEITSGKMSVEDNKLRWKLETETKILEPRTKLSQGNLVITADVDVSASEKGGYYILENSRILANLTKAGSATSITNINTSRLINYIEFKDSSGRTNGTFTFTVNSSAATSTGTGYTELLDSGSGMVAARVVAHVNTTNFDYDIELRLDSKADFIRAELKNVVVK